MWWKSLDCSLLYDPEVGQYTGCSVGILTANHLIGTDTRITLDEYAMLTKKYFISRFSSCESLLNWNNFDNFLSWEWLMLKNGPLTVAPMKTVVGLKQTDLQQENCQQTKSQTVVIARHVLLCVFLELTRNNPLWVDTRWSKFYFGSVLSAIEPFEGTIV